MTSTISANELKAYQAIDSTMDRQQILEHAQEHNVRFLRMQFTDLTGINKNIEVPASQFEKALDGEIQFDGSSVEGFTRIEESDMLLKPDLSTYRIDPWASVGHGISSSGAPR